MTKEKSYNHNTAKGRLSYAKRYYQVLLEEDASTLLSVESAQKRLNIMKALTLLSRYLGRYDTWQQIRKRHNLKWTTGNESFEALQRFLSPNEPRVYYYNPEHQCLKHFRFPKIFLRRTKKA